MISANANPSPGAPPGPRASLTGSEVVTLVIFSQWGRFRSERDFYRYAASRLRSAFPALPRRSQFNLEIVTQRERRGRSHGLSSRVARGVYCRPGIFRSRQVEWDETLHADTGLLGFTTKHTYFSGPKKKFRVRYDRDSRL